MGEKKTERLINQTSCKVEERFSSSNLPHPSFRNKLLALKMLTLLNTLVTLDLIKNTFKS